MSGIQGDILWLLVSLVIILASCELFTNGIEWLGQRLQLGEGIIGSIFAAVGTALPETLIPIVAVIFFNTGKGQDIGIGAIAGAPFMLTTLTLGLCGIATLLFARAGLRSNVLSLNRLVLCRDLRFFICAYSVALLTTAAHALPPVKWVVGIGLLVVYAVYVRRTFKQGGSVGEPTDHLHLSRLMRLNYRGLKLIVPQVLLGTAGILGGAFMFVGHVESIAQSLGVSALILSFIVAPIATEAPEKINSILWSRAGKDTLALANVTGALVFQSCIPVAFGVAMTEWALSAGTLASGVVAVSCAAAYLYLIDKGRLKPIHMVCGAFVYVLAAAYMVISGIATR